MEKKNVERVIFRREHSRLDGDKYLAVFPDDGAGAGKLAYVAFYFSGDTVIFEPYGEMDSGYYYSTKIIHKGTDEARRCLEAVKQYYNSDFCVVEKITKRFFEIMLEKDGRRVKWNGYAYNRSDFLKSAALADALADGWKMAE